MKITTKWLAYTGMLAAVSVILNTLTFTMPGSSYAISFTYIPTFAAGFFMGPFSGFLVGLVGDILGCIIWPKGAWLPLITLASALMGVIPGLVRYIPANDKLLTGLSFLLTFVICSAGVNTFALWQAYASTKKTFWLYLFGRMPLQIINMLVNAIIMYLLFPLFSKLFNASKRQSARVENSTGGV